MISNNNNIFERREFCYCFYCDDYYFSTRGSKCYCGNILTSSKWSKENYELFSNAEKIEIQDELMFQAYEEYKINHPIKDNYSFWLEVIMIGKQKQIFKHFYDDLEEARKCFKTNDSENDIKKLLFLNDKNIDCENAMSICFYISICKEILYHVDSNYSKKHFFQLINQLSVQKIKKFTLNLLHNDESEKKLNNVQNIFFKLVNYVRCSLENEISEEELNQMSCLCMYEIGREYSKKIIIEQLL